MHLNIVDGEIALRPLKDSDHDYQLLEKWLTDPKVLEFYEGRDKNFTLEKIKEKYSPRAKDQTPVKSFILTYQNQEIGYLQFYPIDDPAEYELNDGLQTFGIDLFIGETEFWNQGIGSKALSLVVHYLFKELDARQIVMDPRTDNLRAIKSYEKSGFRKIKILRNHELFEGKRRDCWLMIKKRGQEV